MEYVALFKVIQEGGWVAIIAVMAFFVYRQEKKIANRYLQFTI